MSLTACIRKAGKALNARDTVVIEKSYDKYLKDGLTPTEAATRAVSDRLEDAAVERAGVAKQAKARGAQVGRLRIASDFDAKGVANNLNVIDILYGDAEIEGLDYHFTKAGKRKTTAAELARALSKRARKLNNGKPFSAKTDRNKDIISEVLVEETLAAMQQTGHAGHWYSGTISEAVSIAGIMHPEIETDQNARAAFLMGLAITSNGQPVKTNSELGEKVYAYYKKHGRFEEFGTGVEARAMKKAFVLFNKLQDAWGLDTLREFLNTQFVNSELELLGLTADGEQKSELVYGSAIFGPKVGQAFYQNLSGNFEPVTMDRWWMRTWGRMVGNLAPEGLKGAKDQIDRFRAAIEANPEKVEPFGFDVQTVMKNDRALLELAIKANNKYTRENFTDRSTFNRTAKLLKTRVSDPIVAPRNGAERAWIREVVAEARSKLRQRGFEVDSSTMQALLWFPEKDFYLAQGVGNVKGKPTDYAKEFRAIAEGRRFSRQRITAAITRAGKRHLAGKLGAPVQDPEQAVSEATLGEQEKGALLKYGATSTVRREGGLYPIGSEPKGPSQTLGGAAVQQVFKPGKRPSNIFKTAGLPAPTVLQLVPSQESAALFHAKHPEPKFTPDELELMELYMTEDENAGFALKDEEIVSIFVSKDGDSQALMNLAAARGGRRAMVPDGKIPHFYALQGFKAVSRVNKKDVPDHIYVIFDQDYFGTYDGTAKLYKTDEGALKNQIKLSDMTSPTNVPRGSLRFRLEDADPIVDEEPSSPLAQMNKVAALLDEQSRMGPSGARAIKRTLGDFIQGRGVGRKEDLLGAIPRRYIKDFVTEGKVPASDEYLRIANRMEGRKNELLVRNRDLAKKWAKFVGKNKNQGRLLGEMMHAATLAGVDPAKPYAPLKKKMNLAERTLEQHRKDQYDSLKTWWNKMSPEGQEIYNTVRNAYTQQRIDVEKALEERIAASTADEKVKMALIDEMRLKLESGRAKGPYFPLSRFGDLWAVAKDADGNTVAFSRFERASERADWINSFRAAGYNATGGAKMKDSQMMNRIDPNFVAKVTSMAGSLDAGLADEIWQLYLQALPEMSMRKHFMHRKGRLGFASDALRNFGHTMFHGSHQLSKLEYMHQMESVLDDMETQVHELEKEDDPEALWGAAVYKEMARRHEWARNPQTSVLASNMTSLGFAWYLGVTPAAAMVNLSETAIVGLPTLGSRFNWTGAMKELMKASTLWASSRGPLENRLRGQERLAVSEARRIGLFEKTQAHDLAGVSEAGADLNSKRQQMMEYVSFFFHKAEEFNREVTFLAAYRLGAKEMSHEEAVLVAEDLTWDSHFDYASTNRPRYLQGDWPKVLFLFRQYSMNMTYRMSRDVREATKGLPTAKRTQARERFAGMMIMTALFGGVLSLPGVWAVRMIVDSVMGDDDEDFDSITALRIWMAEMFGDKASEVIAKGPWDAMTGMTLSNRVSLNNLWIRDSHRYLEGSEWAMHYLGELAGPIPAIFIDTAEGINRIDQGYVGRGLEKMTPKVIKDALKMYRYANEGVRSMRGDPILEDVNWLEESYQLFGFTPARLTKQYEQNAALRRAESHIIERHKRVLDHLMLAARNEDPKEIQEAMKNIVKFNQANPTMAIDGGSIMASAKSRAAYSLRTKSGVALNPKLMYLHEKLGFTDTEEK